MQVDVSGDGAAAAHPALLRWILDDIRIAAIVVAADSTLLYANACARDLLDADAYLRVDAGRLAAASAVGTARLGRLVHRVAADAPHAHVSHSLLVPRAPPGGLLQLVLRPAPHPRRDEAGAPGAVLIVAHDDALAAAGLPADLQQTFGLTAAEARLAVLLLAARTPREAADELGVTVWTVRKHLQHLFHKTGTDRQAELVHRLTVTAFLHRAVPRAQPITE